MKTDVEQSEIDQLEKVLDNFKQEWEVLQSKRSSSWRKYFVISFAIAIMLSMLSPSLWWGGIFVIGYFAGSLFMMLRQNAKTSHQINEHQKQLKLVKLLRNFQTSPYSQK
jgi:uncharacterized membrane protein